MGSIIPKICINRKYFQQEVLYLFLKESQERGQGFLSADEISQCLGISRNEFETAYQALLNEKKIELVQSGLVVH